MRGGAGVGGVDGVCGGGGGFEEGAVEGVQEGEGG